MSQRKRSRKDAKSNVQELESGVGNGAETNRGIRRRRGGLEELPKMPLDIIFEVFSHLCPLDLLNLARTTKAFRQLLMSKQSAVHWRTARANVPGLPDIPDDMTEPEFANLLFSSHCHGCLKSNTSEPIWVFRKRYCSDCKLANIVPVDQLLEHEVVGPYFRSRNDPVPCVTLAVNVKGLRKDLAAVHKPELERFQTMLEGLATSEERDAWVEEQRISSTRGINQCNEFILWNNQRRLARQVELGEIREARFDAIVQKLRASNWRPVLDYMSEDANCFAIRCLKSLPIVRQAKPFNLRMWPRIYQEVLPTLEKQLMKSRLETLKRVMQEFRVDAHHFLPGIREFLLNSEFADLIRAPSDVSVTEESFRAMRHHVPEITKAWEDVQRKKISTYVKDTLQFRGEGDPLTLAVGSYFFCHCENCPLLANGGRLWPHDIRSAIAHSSYEAPRKRTFLIGNDKQMHPDMNSTPITELLDYLECPLPRDTVLKLEDPKPWISDLIADMVKMCGLDPLSTTAEQFDKLDARFICLVCSGSGDKHKVFDWRAAVFHAAQCHCDIMGMMTIDDDGSRRLVHERYIEDFSYKLWVPKSKNAELRLHEAEARLRAEVLAQQATSKIWHCARCAEDPDLQIISHVSNHLRVAHSIEKPQDDDFYSVPTSGDEYHFYKGIDVPS
ncbi:hypothetical protein K474DRAFT_1626258 [Panus rudis PR-1116 ss-1]|nr:hypothetical protein K474DRAFT_1626258 [Panus rudis PR-1116 ss-1]